MQNQGPHHVQNPQPQPRPKKRTSNPDGWKRKNVKQARIAGRLHINYKDEVVPAQQYGDIPCRCDPACTTKFTQAEKEQIFDRYRELRSHEQQTLFLRGSILKTQDIANAHSNQYSFTPGNVRIITCKKYFLGLLSIKASRLEKKVLKSNVSVSDGRGKHANHPKLHDEALDAVRNFLDNLNPRESHYSRQDNPHRSYLDSHRSISSLYNDFISEYPKYSPFAVPAQNHAPIPVKKWIFQKIFNFERNISFGYPRSDICERCEQNKAHSIAADKDQNFILSNQLKIVHAAHLEEAEHFYKDMKKEVIEALDNQTACLCFDFEKNLPLPVTNVTREFFSRQLWVYNFGIHNLRGGPSIMYVYSESFARKGPNEVISALKDYIDRYIPLGITKLKLFSDNSGGQNKNKYVMAFLNSLHGRFTEITLSFPVVGHSRMPCDRDFGKIEKNRKKKDSFHFPSDWTNLIRRAQPNLSYQLVYLQHPLTDNLRGDGTPVAMVFDYKAVLEPLLGPPTGIKGFKTFKVVRDGSIRCRKSTTGRFNRMFEILKATTTLNLLKQVVLLAPPAYNDFIRIEKLKFENVTDLLKNIYIPPEKTFYEHLTMA